MHKGFSAVLSGLPKGTVLGVGTLDGPLPQGLLDGLASDLTDQWSPNPTLELDAAITLLGKAIKTGVLSLSVLITGKAIEALEEPIGNGTIDLALRSDAGVEVWDHKWHLKQDPQWVDKELRRTETMTQLWDYASLWLDQHEEAPVMIGKHMVAGAPNKAWRHGVAISPTRLAQWRDSRDYWLQEAQHAHYRWMVHGLRPAMNFSSCFDYGQCPMFAVCHNQDGNPTPPETLYKLRPSS